ncbi:hypothetical protein BDZ45DRAFT_727310 [Acephala macrosclerotiorum]|nr:hypothetical protein BDZ45DRAFT_727310 [Acephala macrosclerotiorum]
MVFGLVATVTGVGAIWVVRRRNAGTAADPDTELSLLDPTTTTSSPSPIDVENRLTANDGSKSVIEAGKSPQKAVITGPSWNSIKLVPHKAELRFGGRRMPCPAIVHSLSYRADKIGRGSASKSARDMVVYDRAWA